MENGVGGGGGDFGGAGEPQPNQPLNFQSNFSQSNDYCRECVMAMNALNVGWLLFPFRSHIMRVI